METCPYCGASFDIDGWDTLDDEGDVIVATAMIECECGENIRVRGYYHWDGDYEID